MADSTVTFTNIDEEYPVAGQDNDTQGFRDNFREIKTSLQSANTELSQLLTNSARLDQANDFNGNSLSNASTRAISEDVFNTGNINQDTTIEWSDGLYQNVTVTDNVTLILGGWDETGHMSKITMAIRSDTVGREITWEAANGGAIRVGSITWPEDGNGNKVTVTETFGTDPLMIDAWTTDGGQTVHLEYRGTFEVLT